MTAITELDTFIHKFNQLWHSGLNAHLNLESHAGQACFGLHLQLGDVPGPPHGTGASQRSKSSPSRDLHRECCAAERVAKASKSDIDISDETSAAEGTNVNEVFTKVAQNHLKLKRTFESTNLPDSI